MNPGDTTVTPRAQGSGSAEAVATFGPLRTRRCPCGCGRALAAGKDALASAWSRLEWFLAQSTAARRWLVDGPGMSAVDPSTRRAAAWTAVDAADLVDEVLFTLHDEAPSAEVTRRGLDAAADAAQALLVTVDLARALGGPGLGVTPAGPGRPASA